MDKKDASQTYPPDLLDIVGRAAREFSLQWPIPKEKIVDSFEGMMAWSERTIKLRARFFDQIEKQQKEELSIEELAGNVDKLNQTEIAGAEESLCQFYYRFMLINGSNLDKRDIVKGYGRSFDEIRSEEFSKVESNEVKLDSKTLIKIKALELLDNPYLGLTKAMENIDFINKVIAAKTKIVAAEIHQK